MDAAEMPGNSYDRNCSPWYSGNSTRSRLMPEMAAGQCNPRTASGPSSALRPFIV